MGWIKEGKDINRNKYGWYWADCKRNKVVACQKKGYPIKCSNA